MSYATFSSTVNTASLILLIVAILALATFFGSFFVGLIGAIILNHLFRKACYSVRNFFCGEADAAEIEAAVEAFMSKTAGEFDPAPAAAL